MRFGLALVLLFCLAAAPATQPADPEHKVWELTSYLRGTAAQIRHILNGEIIRITNGVNDTSRQLEDSKADLERDTRNCMDQAHARPDYKEFHDQMEQAAKDLEFARSQGTIDQRMSVSSRYNRCKQTCEQIEQAALAADRNVPADQKRIAELSTDLKGAKASLEKAASWRAELLEAAGNSLKLDGWPMEKGAEGILGELRVVEAKDGIAGCPYELLEETGTSNGPDGIVKIKGLAHPVVLMIHGLDLTNIHGGSTIKPNRTFRVINTVRIQGEIFVEVEPAPGPLDLLWEKMTAPITPEEMAAARKR